MPPGSEANDAITIGRLTAAFIREWTPSDKDSILRIVRDSRAEAASLREQLNAAAEEFNAGWDAANGYLVPMPDESRAFEPGETKEDQWWIGWAARGYDALVYERKVLREQLAAARRALEGLERFADERWNYYAGIGKHLTSEGRAGQREAEDFRAAIAAAGVLAADPEGKR